MRFREIFKLNRELSKLTRESFKLTGEHSKLTRELSKRTRELSKLFMSATAANSSLTIQARECAGDAGEFFKH